jgi:hypothetical protein
MKKITLLVALMITSLGFAQQNFPFTFEIGTTVFNDFSLGLGTQVTNPSQTGINTSANVAKIVRGNDAYSGSKITLAAPIDFSVNKIIKMKVWFPVAGQSVILKLETNPSTPGDFEQRVDNIPGGVWTEISFDYQTKPTINTKTQLTFLFNPGTAGDGSANSTYYFDDITFEAPAVVIVYDPIVLPLDFENPNQNFSSFGDFNGGVMTKVANPDPTGNSSATCLKMVKGPGGAIYGGSSFFLSSPLDLSLGKYFRMNVWSPKAGGKVALKFEGTGAIFDMISGPLVMGWQTVTFDGTALTTGGSYNKLVLFNELNEGLGDGTANSTYYYDDIRQATTLSTAKFESSSIKMYPNPVRNSLTIDANSSIQKVSVYNILGQEVMRVSPKSNSVTLQTSALQKGAYMVQTEIDGNISTSKIIKE